MKRKLLAALCVTAMSASLLAGCGSSDKTEDTTKTEETKTEETSDQEKTATDSSSDSSEVKKKVKKPDSLMVRRQKTVTLRMRAQVCFWTLLRN